MSSNTPRKLQFQVSQWLDEVDPSFRLFQIGFWSQYKAPGEASQCSTLHYGGQSGQHIFHLFELSEDQKKDYAFVKAKFDSYFIKRKNVIYEHAVFNRQKQEEGESVETFITALYSLVEHCKYGNLRKEMIRDRIVAGVRNSALSLKLQLKDKLTLEEAVTYVREVEMIKKQQPLIRDDQKESARVGVDNKRGGRQDYSQGPRTRKGPGAKRTTNGQVCTRCGKSPPHDCQHCPARDAICHNCSKRGHYKAMCKSSKKVGEVHQEIPSEQNEDSEAFLGTIETDDGNPWIISLRVRNKVIDSTSILEQKLVSFEIRCTGSWEAQPSPRLDRHWEDPAMRFCQ